MQLNVIQWKCLELPFVYVNAPSSKLVADQPRPRFAREARYEGIAAINRMEQLGVGTVHDRRAAMKEQRPATQQGVHQAGMRPAADRDTAVAERICQQALEHRIDALRHCQDLQHPRDLPRSAVIDIAPDRGVVLAVYHPAAERAAPRLGSCVAEDPLQACGIPIGAHRIGFGQAWYLLEQQLVAGIAVIFVARWAGLESK